MKLAYSMFMALLLATVPAMTRAQAPYSTQPNYDPNIPVQFGAGGERMIVPLPPQLPEYLPNGAINLDEVWIQDGGARLYWNNVIIPKELKMAGNYWIDPALVPQLIPDKKAPVRRVWRKARTTKVRKVKVPPNVASTALKSPAIPLPVTPVEPDAQSIPPLKAAPAKNTAAPAPAHVSPRAETEMPDVTPPPLQ